MTDLPAAKVPASPPPAETALARVIAEARLPGASAGFADFLPDAEAIVQRRHSPYATWLIYTLVLLAAAVIGWMHVAQIEDVVTAPGVVRAAGGGGTAISHPDGGRVRQMLVRDGDLVRQGQPLALLDADPALPNADPVLRAPIDGMAAGLDDVAAGTRIGPGMAVGMVLPTGRLPRLEIEVRVAGDDIGAVAVGQDATAKLHPIRLGMVRGRVVAISPEAVATAGRPYTDPAFTVRIAIPAESPGGAPHRHLFPGMTARVDLHVGKRSILTMLTDSITRGFTGSRHAQGN